MSKVVLVKTTDRREGVIRSLQALSVNPVKGKDVLIKPNFNTADITPGSTHNDTLEALVNELWSMGAKSISLGERSYPPVREVMEAKGVIPLLQAFAGKVIDFDQLAEKDWVHVTPKGSHWQNGFRVARPSWNRNVSYPRAASRLTSTAGSFPCPSSSTSAWFPLPVMDTPT